MAGRGGHRKVVMVRLRPWKPSKGYAGTISALVSVADDGGSSGRLKQPGFPPSWGTSVVAYLRSHPNRRSPQSSSPIVSPPATCQITRSGT